MRKIIIIVIVACTLVLLGGYAGYRGYRVWRQKHMLSLAQDFLAKKDARNAILSLQQVLRVNPINVEANRLMAQLSEAARSPAAVIYRSRVVQINSKSTPDRLALAQTALMFRDYTTATNALEGIDEAGRKTVSYHNLAGTVALSGGQVPDAEAHFAEAVRLDPENPAPRLNLAVIHLGTNATAAAKADARAVLTQISASATNAYVRSQAIRELLTDAVRSKQTNVALTLSKSLVGQTNATFGDRLIYLDVLLAAGSAEYKPTLESMRTEAAKDNGKIYEFTQWQLTRTTPSETLSWLNGLPPASRTNMPATLLLAECRTVVKDWKGLQNGLTNQFWGDLEFTRHAFLARALRGQDMAGAAKGEWELALKTSNERKETLIMLLKLAAQWKWQSEGEEILWTIVNGYPEEKWAPQSLSLALYAGGRTRSLMSFYSQQLKLRPGDLATKNNLAVTALLLEAPEFKPHELAREVYQVGPTNAILASTYALSLYLQKKYPEALGALEKLTPTELKNPSIAGYYGLALKGTGNTAKAQTYFDIASKTTLLPEERKLFGLPGKS